MKKTIISFLLVLLFCSSTCFADHSINIIPEIPFGSAKDDIAQITDLEPSFSEEFGFVLDDFETGDVTGDLILLYADDALSIYAFSAIKPKENGNEMTFFDLSKMLIHEFGLPDSMSADQVLYDTLKPLVSDIEFDGTERVFQWQLEDGCQLYAVLSDGEAGFLMVSPWATTENRSKMKKEAEIMEERECSITSSLEGPGYSSAKLAAKSYIEALENADITEMLSTFAIEHYVDYLDTETYMKYYGAASPLQSGEIVPISGEYSSGILAAKRLSSLIDNLYHQYICCMLKDTEYYRTVWGLKKQDDVAAYLQAYSNVDIDKMIKNIEILDVYDVYEFSQYFEIDPSGYSRYSKNVENRKKAINCDEIQEMTVRFTIDGKEYWQFFQCGRYGDKWYNISLTPIVFSMLADTSDIFDMRGLVSSDYLNQCFG